MYTITKLELCYLTKKSNFGNSLVTRNLTKSLNTSIMTIIDTKNENIDLKLCPLKLKDINLSTALNKKKISS